ncbi:MAG TPA: DUF3455 domain-containing protein [Bryobacteraceae bacterium]|nr:DUF3455 domain-containing protein [Bryobacteraceae bacterium]
MSRCFVPWKSNFQPVRLVGRIAAFVVTGALAPLAVAGGITPPPTPLSITPPAGNTAFLMGNAVGTQGYVCLPSGSGASWTVDASRPQATLFFTFGPFIQQILTHFLSPDTNPNQFAPNPLPFGSPTWQSSLDSSAVWGNKLASIAAGSDPSCPNSGAIPCLLLQAIGSQAGPTGGKLMTLTTYIQRLNTAGGSAPSTGCAQSSDVGAQVLVPYTADYYFYKAQ